MYEHHRQELLNRSAFVRRLARHGVVALLLVLGSLALGTGGFHLLCRQAWVDAFLTSAMLLGGMGPVGDPGEQEPSVVGASAHLLAVARKP